MEALKQFMSGLTPKEKVDFADKCGTTLNYLRKVMSTKSIIGPEICVQIEIHSAGAVNRKDLNPEGWEFIWPELKDRDNAV